MSPCNLAKKSKILLINGPIKLSHTDTHTLCRLNRRSCTYLIDFNITFYESVVVFLILFSALIQHLNGADLVFTMLAMEIPQNQDIKRFHIETDINLHFNVNHPAPLTLES